MKIVEQQVIQNALNSWYIEHGTYCSYPDICHHIVTEGNIPEESDFSFVHSDFQNQQSFLNALMHKPCELYDSSIHDSPEITEKHFHGNLDVNVAQLFYNISDNIHMHDCFEIAYVYKGSCTLSLESDKRLLNEGNILIIAPGTWHNVQIQNEDNTVILIMIRKSTFQNNFFGLLTQENPLGGFFRTVLYGNQQSHYLLFSTEGSAVIRHIIQNITFHIMIEDGFTNELLVSHVNILFAELLRNHSDSIRYLSENNSITQIPMILRYIQQNYSHLSLETLAETFHYNSSYLSVLLKSRTGYTYTQIVNRHRMTDAAYYLSSSKLRISEISDLTGFQSPDAFTKTFQKYYGQTPTQFRNHNIDAQHLADSYARDNNS